MTRTVLRGGRVFDGSGAETTLTDIAIESGRIAALGTGLDGDEVIDATGALVAPGLIDAHVHAMFAGMDFAKIQSQPFSLPFYEAIGNLRRLLDSGVTTARDAGGTDSGVFAHGSSHRELTMLVQAGMTPPQALHAATGSAAGLLELDDVGRIAVGCAADLIVLDGDAWDFTRYSGNLAMVIQGGTVRRDHRRPATRT
ncbi:hypothetical protein DP939_33070 [Spongiactinospora rosea]|uniref:Amidohydrolase family protein n=1 Tax=Spongiactinospora rosea TaxID=2248750 RepID=A0A366LRA8_9ACTN|nr:amidohydrolase family protein [Spongiactinospora rosea]RBQ15844.1 hypothetical protein DP939_33070 [Spongiactinospora rosea]